MDVSRSGHATWFSTESECVPWKRKRSNIQPECRYCFSCDGATTSRPGADPTTFTSNWNCPETAATVGLCSASIAVHSTAILSCNKSKSLSPDPAPSRRHSKSDSFRAELRKKIGMFGVWLVWAVHRKRFVLVQHHSMERPLGDNKDLVFRA